MKKPTPKLVGMSLGEDGSSMSAAEAACTPGTTLCRDGKRRKGPLYWAWVRRFEGQIAPVEGRDQIIYEYRPNGNLVGELPIGARLLPRGECGTLDRNDGGDPFHRALFTSPSGRVYVVERQV